MKKLYIGCLALFMSFLWACHEEEQGVVPSVIGGLKAEAMEGAICLRWNVPADSNYLYVRIQYTNPRDGELVIKNTSVYCDSLLIDGLLAKDGEYHFALQTVSTTGTVGTDVSSVSSRALPVKSMTTKFSEKVELEEKDLSTNAQEPSEGPIANLIDGDLDNYFHSAWGTPVPYPQWIQIELTEPLQCFEFKTWNMNRGDGYPEWVIIQGSNDGKSWEDLLEINGEIPTTPKGKYESPVITIDEPYSKLRYTVKQSFGGLPFFHLAEFEWSKVWFDIYDPENQ